MVSIPLVFVLGLNVLGLVAVLASGILTFISNQHRPLNRVFFMAMMVLAVYLAEYIVTPLLPSERAAYLSGFLSIVIVFIPAFFSKLLFIAAGVEREYRWYTRLVFFLASVLVAASLLFPTLFLEGVAPRLYFPWWLVPGPLFLAVSVFFLVAHLLPFIVAAQRQRVLPEHERRRLGYFLTFIGIALPLGSMNLLLTFGIPFGPFLAALWPLGMVPIAYGILNDRLLDIRVVAARAALYSGGIAALAALLALLISLNNVIIAAYPWLQFWVVPIFTATVAFVVGRVFWVNRLENDRVKYEFITVATHKLRTPLTQISWGVRTLLDRTPDPETRQIIEHIQHSSNRLIELTNILFETTEEESQEYAYSKERVGLLTLTHEALERLQSVVDRKHLTVNVHSDQEVYVDADRRRLSSVIEVILENAVSYTAEGGLVQIITYVKRGRAYYSVRDQGIGVSPEDQKRIFSRFYRTDAAKRIDTEGVGLGLAMAKSIIGKHRGKMGVESQGEGKGSTFWFWVPPH